MAINFEGKGQVFGVAPVYNGARGEATEGRLVRCNGKEVFWPPRWVAEHRSDRYEGEREHWIEWTDVGRPSFHLDTVHLGDNDAKRFARFRCTACGTEWFGPA